LRFLVSERVVPCRHEQISKNAHKPSRMAPNV
jgi:hypothetical protein